MVSDIYSKKDSNRNRKIELKQARIQIAIWSVCIGVCAIMAMIYYAHTHENTTAKSLAPKEAPAIVSDVDHTYDTSRPPYKQ